MAIIFIIEDDLHAEPQDGRFASFEEAFGELSRRATLPWDESPNVAPCSVWKECGRIYQIIEYDDSTLPWGQVSCVRVMKISAEGVKWLVAP
jgi:hypothetical protein